MSTTRGAMMQPNDHHDQMIAKLALVYNLITSEQYLMSVSVKTEGADAGSFLRLTDILVDKGFLTDEQLDFLLQAKDLITQRRKEKRFGHIAVSQGFITHKELSEALAVQKKEQAEIGQILLDLGILTEDQQKSILHLQASTQVHIPTLDDMRRLIDEKNGHASPEKEALVLNVSQDALRAVLVFPESRRDVTLQEIRRFLDDQGICFGMEDDEVVEDSLACRGLGLHAFIAARGQKSLPPETGPIVYHFDAPPLNLDLDTGKRPMIQKGECVAERELIRQGKPRITVYGAGLDETGVTDGLFIPGNGTRMDETRCRIIAMYEGEPFHHPDGAICVLKELVLTEADLLPDPVRHDGTLRITGAIPPNADIHAVHILAGSVDGAVIKSDGNLWVDGDLTKTTVIAAGSVYAQSISKCRISCMGDVFSETDITGSDIDTQARCHAGKRISHSRIRAVRGIDALSVGGEKTDASTLEFGGDWVPAYIDADLAAVRTLEQAIQEIVARINGKESMLRISRQVIDDIQREMDKHERERALLSKNITRMEQKSKRQIANGRNRLVTLGLDIQAAGDTLAVLSKDLASIREAMAPLKKSLGIKMREYKELKATISRKISLLKQRLKGHPRTGGVRVKGSIQENTCIKGPNTTITLSEHLDKVMIRENHIKDQDPTMPQGYAMEIGPLK